VYASLQFQTAVLSYVDAYRLLSMCSAPVFASLSLPKKNEPRKGGKSQFTRILGVTSRPLEVHLLLIK